MRNVLVTGGSRGVGLAIARTLARAGFRVVALARSEGTELPAVRVAVEKEGCGALHFCAYDLSNTEGMAELVKSLSREYGAFYGLVNNAGLGTPGILANMPNGEIERLVRLNVISPMILTKYVARSMMTVRGGRIVNISSVVSVAGYSGLSVYSATKAAALGFTRSLARELGPVGITVNAISPGFLDTEMTHDLNPAQRAQIARRSALQRMAEIDDVAHLADYLFSEKARNITGTVMTVDAGNTA